MVTESGALSIQFIRTCLNFEPANPQTKRATLSVLMKCLSPDLRFYEIEGSILTCIVNLMLMFGD